MNKTNRCLGEFNSNDLRVFYVLIGGDKYQ